jgi:hypothetical protein
LYSYSVCRFLKKEKITYYIDIFNRQKFKTFEPAHNTAVLQHITRNGNTREYRDSGRYSIVDRGCKFEDADLQITL